MTAFVLNPKPTFDLTIKVPVPGEEPAPLTLTCRYRSGSELKAYLDSVGKQEENSLATFKDLVVGWKLAESFSDENINTLLDNYPSAIGLVIEAYVGELLGNRQKN